MHQNNEKFTFIDLYDHKKENYEDLFFSCDPHWSENGNEWAGDIISNGIDIHLQKSR